MEKGLFGPNRYEITAIIPEKAIKSRGKAEKPVRRANFVSKWYVTPRKFLAIREVFSMKSPLAGLMKTLR